MFLAPNPSPLTLDGTRTYVVGRGEAAVIDPGPADDRHLRTLARELADATSIVLLLTHGHPDHAAAAHALAGRLASPVLRLADGSLVDGQSIPTDAGELVAVSTPGHTPDHAAFHWPAAEAVFCGDLMLGGLDSALVAPPEGDLGAYLESLERVRTLRPRVLLPSHGPPFTDPPAALDRYRRHRQERLAQVLAALADRVAPEEELVGRVYGAELEPRLWPAARAALRAYLHHLESQGRVRRSGDGWVVRP